MAPTYQKCVSKAPMQMTADQFRTPHTTNSIDYKKQYRVALDEVSTLLERNRELEAKLEGLQTSHPDQIVSLTERLAQLEEQLQHADQNRPCPPEIIPLALQVQSKVQFDKLILSLGMYGTIKDAERLDNLQLKFDSNAMSNLRNDQEDYLSQFLPMIVEDLRSKVAQRFAELEKTTPPPHIADVSSVDFEERNQNKPKNKHKVQEDFRYVTLSCTTPKNKFPKVDHGFNKELMCLMLPTSKVNPRSFNVVLAIGSASPCHDPSEENVRYTVKMLAHDYQHLLGHERKVKQSNVVTRVRWHHLAGLVPSARMYEACSPGAPLLFPRQVMYHEKAPWPGTFDDDYDDDDFELNPDLNETQSKLVKSFATMDETGMFYLVGPPGTGKTTTIAELLIERVECYPDEKILLTAPSNKAIQVVLNKLMERLKAGGSKIAVAVIATGKHSSGNHETLSVGNFTSSLIKNFEDALRLNKSWQVKKDHLLVAVDTVVAHFMWLMDPERAGLPVAEESSAPVQKTFDWFSRNTCHAVVDEKSLKKHGQECKQQLQSVAEHVDSFILQKAHIVFGTLVASGRSSLFRTVPIFDTVIVDEASQALLPATFIPFKFSPARYLLVGDPQQLPATVNADKLKDLGYADSLMLVMHNAFGGADKYAKMLTTQYRMHPSICKPISDLFYGGKLETADAVLTRPSELKKLPQQMALSALPSAFIDLDSVENKEVSGSTSNFDEAELVVKIVRYLLEHDVKPSQIGINTGYKAQVLLIQHFLLKLVQESGKLRGADLRELAVSTVDGFQGDERDFILFSCVRTNTHSVGFLKDKRRINVALSRARHACWVFGQQRCLADSNSSISDFLGCVGRPSADTIFPPTTVVSAEALLSSMGLPRSVNVPSASRWGPPPVLAVPPPRAATTLTPSRGVKRGPPGELYNPKPPPPPPRMTYSRADYFGAASFAAPVGTLPSESFAMEPTLSALGPNQLRALSYQNKKSKTYTKNFVY